MSPGRLSPSFDDMGFMGFPRQRSRSGSCGSVRSVDDDNGTGSSWQWTSGTGQPLLSPDGRRLVVDEIDNMGKPFRPEPGSSDLVAAAKPAGGGDGVVGAAGLDVDDVVSGQLRPECYCPITVSS